MLPLKTTIDDFDALGGYLKTQVGWVPVAKIKATIDPKHADNRKLEAGKFIGFLVRDGANVRLTDLGRRYATATGAPERVEAMLDMLLSVDLYAATVHWMHFSNQTEPTKTTIGIYWHDHHGEKLAGAQGDGLTDAVVFFLRLAGAAGLGQYIGAGRGRPETYLKGDAAAIEAAAQRPAVVASDGTEGVADEVETTTDVGGEAQKSPPSPIPHQPLQPAVSTSPAVHVNIEIHIAADATAATVEEIFKNMRKYVLNAPAEDGK